MHVKAQTRILTRTVFTELISRKQTGGMRVVLVYRVIVQSVRMLVLGTSGWGIVLPSPYQTVEVVEEK